MSLWITWPNNLLIYITISCDNGKGDSLYSTLSYKKHFSWQNVIKLWCATVVKNFFWNIFDFDRIKFRQLYVLNSSRLLATVSKNTAVRHPIIEGRLMFNVMYRFEVIRSNTLYTLQLFETPWQNSCLHNKHNRIMVCGRKWLIFEGCPADLATKHVIPHSLDIFLSFYAIETNIAGGAAKSIF